jgi:succinoglycan biosynthesis transport protein ExoP
MPQYELNIRDYWQIIRKRSLVLVIIFCAVLTFSIIYTNTQKPIYQATASVQWIERRSLGGLLTELVSVTTGDPLLTQARVITSRLILAKVIVELGLIASDASPEEITRRADALKARVRTEVVENTDIIRIKAIDANPQLAALMANKIAEVYIAENIKERNKQNHMVRAFIEKQLEEIGAKLKESEETLARFQEVEVPSGIALPLQNRLADLEAKSQNLLRQYTDIHPDVKNIKKEISRVKEQLKALPQKELEYSRLRRDVEINAKLFRELKEKFESARIAEAEKVEDVGLVESALPPALPLRPNKPLNYFLGTALGLMLGLSGAFLVEQLDTSIGTIEDVENYLKLPALGIIPYLKTAGEERRGLIQKLWPKSFKGKEKALRLKKQLLIHYSNSSTIFEAYRMLRTNIQSEIFKGKIQGKILLFSSSGPEEGKSITTANLAITMAQAGLRTLLIDADMRRSEIHNIFGIEREPGLFNILSGTAELRDVTGTFTDILISETGFDEVLKLPGLDNLNILVSGSKSATPAELLASSEMAGLLEEARGNYDIILIDSPPVLAVADAVILASKVDGVVLVYRVGRTARSILSRAKTQLVEAGAQVKGIVLNNISPQMEMRYGYYYNYKYYGKYYSSAKEKDKNIKEKS